MWLSEPIIWNNLQCDANNVMHNQLSLYVTLSFIPKEQLTGVDLGGVRTPPSPDPPKKMERKKYKL